MVIVVFDKKGEPHGLSLPDRYHEYCLSIDVGIGGVFLDELTAWSYVITHQHGEYLVSLCGILDGYLLQ